MPAGPGRTSRSSEPFNGLSLIVLACAALRLRHASRQSYGPLSFGVRPKNMKPPKVIAMLFVCTLTSCGFLMDAVFENVFESSRDRKIRDDTDNLRAGRPLQHHSSEKRLRVARDDRLLQETMNLGD